MLIKKETVNDYGFFLFVFSRCVPMASAISSSQNSPYQNLKYLFMKEKASSSVILQKSRPF